MLHPIVAEDMDAITSAPINWSLLAGKSILITGASGFLPAYMVEAILHLNQKENLGCKIFGLVRNLAKAKTRFAQFESRDDLTLLEGDVAQAQEFPERCDFIIHAASQASPKFYGCDPVGTMTANLLGSYHLLYQAVKWNVEGFLFFSSGEVYGQVTPDRIPTKESDYGYTDITQPRSCYAESKRAAETLGVSFAAQFGVPFKTVRPFHTYGPGMALDDGRIFADLVRDVVLRKNLVIHSDGKAVRAFCYLSDAIRGFFTVLLHGERAQAYNVGNPEGILSINQLAALLLSLTPDRQLRIEQNPIQRAQSYLSSPISINSPNVDKLKALGWHPQLLPREGFSRTLRFFTA